MLFEHCVRRAASRADWTSGTRSAPRTPLMAFTTSNSTNVNARRNRRAKSLRLIVTPANRREEDCENLVLLCPPIPYQRNLRRETIYCLLNGK